MVGLVFGILIVVAVGAFATGIRDAKVPKCRTCHQPRAKGTKGCLHCGAE